MKSLKINYLPFALILILCRFTSQAPPRKHESVDNVSNHLLYPFEKSDYLANVRDNNRQELVNLDFRLPYYGSTYNFARISLDGSVFFDARQAEILTYPLHFPQIEWPLKADPSFIGLFYAKSRIALTPGADLSSGVYFRKYRNIGKQNEDDVYLKEAIKRDINEGIIGAADFDPLHVIILTWNNISFSNGINTEIVNTYQLLLATDEVRTYAIFNYEKINWSSAPESGGDTLLGQGGISAFVGFNAGNGTSAYEYLPYSQTPKITDLLAEGRVNGFPGRHIFRIDEEILRGTCNYKPGHDELLVISPESGNMLGGTLINITGPCFSPSEEITLKFHDQIIHCTYRSHNLATCVTPQIYTVGFVDVVVSLNKIGTKLFKNKFYIENPVLATEILWFENPFELHSLDAKSIKIYWNPTNLTNSNREVSINLWSYRETESDPELVFIDTLVNSTFNDGFEILDVKKLQERDNGLLRDLHFGLIQINVTNPSLDNLRQTPIIWSRPIPLGWYFKKQWEKYYGLTWTERFCEEWILEDEHLNSFTQSLPQCPCNLAQATQDLRFVSDPFCDILGNMDCYGSRRIAHCVRSGQPSSNGGGQHCCYGVDGNLVMNTDFKIAGFPSRSNLLGSRPYNKITKIPGLSYWFNDLRPLYTCCKWQGEMTELCYQFKSMRPSNDCKGYTPLNASTVFGDPHFVTFDNTEYTFNGLGEYSLLNVHNRHHNLDVQGRFEQIINPSFKKLATAQLTAIVAKSNVSSSVEIQIRSGRMRYHLSALVDKKKVYFDRPSSRLRSLEGATVYTPSNIYNQSRIVVTFDSGAAVEVLENLGSISARIFLPTSFKNSTKGLMGNWSDDEQNEFILPSGDVIPNNSTDEELYFNFGDKWGVNDTNISTTGMKSLFYHEFGRNSSSYLNNSYVPEFNREPPNSWLDLEDVAILCGFENYQCRYDYIITQNKQFAEATKYSIDTFRKLKMENLKTIITCGSLLTPCHGRKSTNLNLIGTVVMFECEKGYILKGDPVRWCLESGEWSKLVQGETQCISEETSEDVRRNLFPNSFC